jgi:tRNA (guanine37-N1)-methyltransferase
MNIFHVSILTLFPEIFPGPLQYSLAGQALRKNIWSYDVINIKDFGITKHKKVDDEQFGGACGLVMRPDVLSDALDFALMKKPETIIYYPSPRGKLLSQNFARNIITQKNIIILCGRFEGIDERIIEGYNIQEISIGDYILSGGEIAAFVLLDVVTRLLPGVVKNTNSLLSESFEQDGEFAGMLECPLYTRPAKWRDRCVPEVLLSGNHQKIREWKQEQSREITMARRADLLNM